MEQILANLKYVGLGLYLLFILRFLFLSFKNINDIWLYEYENLPEQWEKDGKPRGMKFWKFPKFTWMEHYKLTTFRSATISPMLWLFVNPGWADGHPEVLKHLRDLRKNVLGWNIGFLLFLFLIVLTLSL